MPVLFTYRSLAGRLAVSALALALCTAGLANGLPVAPTTVAAVPDAAIVSLRADMMSVPVDGALALHATVLIDRPTSYLEARLQVRRPSGQLVYQKTEVRSNLSTGSVTIDYARELEDLEFAPGSYPVELRVRTQSNEVREWVVQDNLLVYARNPVRVPLSVIAYVCAAPSIDADGRFSIDPASSVRARDDAEALAQATLDRPSRRLTLAIPGILLEEWARVAEGYEVASPEGVRSVPASDPAPREYARALDTIRRAMQTGRLEVASTPYASPDIGALQLTDRIDDLEDHILRGNSAHLSVLGTEPSPTVVLPQGLLPQAGLEAIAGHGADACVVAPGSLDTTLPSGAYPLADESDFTALVTDLDTESCLQSSETSALVAAVFRRAVSEDASAPIVSTVRLGPGQHADSAHLIAMLAALESAPWVEFVTATGAAAAAGTTPASLARTVDALPSAPAHYWTEAAEAREYAHAFVQAVGVNDPDAQHASDLSLMAQSASWAGPDLNWGSAERGRSLAAAARRAAGSVLDAIELGASEITLSGAGGEIPVSITNSSEKNLTLTVRTRAVGLTVDESMVATQQVRPQENFVTVPVDLGQSLSGRLTVDVLAGDVLLDTVTVTVRASFLDRLVVIVGVAIVLAGMLLYIRRRIQTTTGAGTIRDGSGAEAGEKT